MKGRRSRLFHDHCLETGWLRDGIWTDTPVRRRLTKKEQADAYRLWIAHHLRPLGGSPAYRTGEARRRGAVALWRKLLELYEGEAHPALVTSCGAATSQPSSGSRGRAGISFSTPAGFSGRCTMVH